MYNRFRVGSELRKKLQTGCSPSQIGHWAYGIYLENCGTGYKDEFLDEVLLSLNLMEDGDEFECSREKLMNTAMSLMSGKSDIKLHETDETDAFKKYLNNII